MASMWLFLLATLAARVVLCGPTSYNYVDKAKDGPPRIKWSQDKDTVIMEITSRGCASPDRVVDWTEDTFKWSCKASDGGEDHLLDLRPRDLIKVKDEDSAKACKTISPTQDTCTLKKDHGHNWDYLLENSQRA